MPDGAPPDAPGAFRLGPDGHARPRERDVAMLYDLLLGREAEGVGVLRDHAGQPFATTLRTFLASDEFRLFVLEPLARGEALRHAQPGPRPAQVEWLLGRTVLDAPTVAALRRAGSWEAFFAVLLPLRGFLPEQAPHPPASLHERLRQVERLLDGLLAELAAS